MDLDTAVKILKKFINDFKDEDMYYIFKKDIDEVKQAFKIIEDHLFDDIWYKVKDTELELGKMIGSSVLCKWEDGCIEPFPAMLIKSYNENPAKFGKIIEWKVYYEP